MAELETIDNIENVMMRKTLNKNPQWRMSSIFKDNSQR